MTKKAQHWNDLMGKNISHINAFFPSKYNDVSQTESEKISKVQRIYFNPMKVCKCSLPVCFKWANSS